MRFLHYLIGAASVLLACARRDATPISVPSYGPPQALVESIGTCPGPDDAWTWQPGYYRWTGTFYTWEYGAWVSRPAPEARWKPGVWLPRTYGWTFVPGYWY